MTKLALREVEKFSQYYSVEIENWKIEEPNKNYQDITRILESYRETRDIIYQKLKMRFHDFLI